HDAAERTDPALRLSGSEAVWPIGREVEPGLAAGDERGYEPAGDRRQGQADMAVAESEPGVAVAQAAADDRQRVGQRRAKSHPVAAAAIVERPEQAAAALQQHLEAGRAGRRVEAAELDGAGDAQP